MSAFSASLVTPSLNRDIRYTSRSAKDPVPLGGLDQYPLSAAEQASLGLQGQTALGPLGQTDVNLNATIEFANTHDLNFMANVGYQEAYEPIKMLMSPQMFRMISSTITSLLQGLDKNGRPIIVPYKTIASVLFNVYQNRSPIIGDIYSRYIITNDTTRDDVRTLVDQTIEVIVNQIRNEYEMIENNNKLTIWTTVLGDFNEHGLRQHAPIKIRHKHPDYMQFNMNY